MENGRNTWVGSSASLSSIGLSCASMLRRISSSQPGAPSTINPRHDVCSPDCQPHAEAHKRDMLQQRHTGRLQSRRAQEFQHHRSCWGALCVLSCGCKMVGAQESVNRGMKLLWASEKVWVAEVYKEPTGFVVGTNVVADSTSFRFLGRWYSRY